MDDIKSVALNVLSEFISMGLVALFYWSLAKHRKNQLNSAQAVTLPSPIQTPIQSSPSRAVPIARPVDLGVWGYSGLTYFFTVLLIYFSVSAAPTLKASFSRQPVLLSDAFFVGHWLPSIPLTGEYFQWVFVVITVLLFMPCMSIATFVKNIVVGLIPSLATNARIKFGIHYLTVVALCAPIAATSIVLFFAKSYRDAFTYVGLIAFICVAIASNQKNGT